jgi:predicted amidohydrolase/ribulose-5-phosphate 4-epimerase/fuculose-1-phosphate aldolase
MTNPTIKTNRLSKKIKKASKVVVGLYQPEIYEDLFEMRGKMHILKEKDEIYEKILKIIVFAIEKEVNILCFPELFMNEKFCERIKNYISDLHSDIIIIGGSYYKRNINTCPIITKNSIYSTEKIIPSPLEDSPASSTDRIIGGEMICYNKSSFGNFVVLICSDFTKTNIRQKIFKHVDEKDIDIIFVIACNRDSSSYHEISSMLVRDKRIYICYCNSIGKINKGFEADGRTSIFGIMHKDNYQTYYNMGLLFDMALQNRVCEIEDENIIVAEFDLDHKRVDFPRAGDEKLNINIRYPKQIDITLSYDDTGFSYLEISNILLKSKINEIKNKNHLFRTIWGFISERVNEDPLSYIPISLLMQYVKERTTNFVEAFFDKIREENPQMQRYKVKKWQGTLEREDSIRWDLRNSDADDIIKACNELVKEYPEMSPKLNVISEGIFIDDKIDKMIITGHNTDKNSISVNDLFVVKYWGVNYRYNGHDGTPSSETAINWRIHEVSRSKYVIHLNTMEIKILVAGILTDPDFYKIIKDHPYIKVRENNNIPQLFINRIGWPKYCFPIVEKSFNVDVQELSNIVAKGFKQAIDGGEDIGNIVVLGVKHAIWFAMHDISKLIDKANNINKAIHKLSTEINLLKGGCRHCHGKFDITEDGAYCQKCKITVK